jgi:large subunit ribosomal protein L25
MASYDLKAQTREAAGKSAAKKLRATGQVPAVAYGKQDAPQTLSVGAHDLWDVLAHHHAHGLLNLKFDDGTTLPVIIKAVQRHPVTHRPNSVDFLRVSLNEEVEATVPVVLHGEAAGIADGGVLVQALHEIKIKALPANLPEEIQVDVSGLIFNGPPIHVREIALPEGVSVVTDGDESVAVVNPPDREPEPEVEAIDASEVPATEQAGEEEAESEA